MRGSAKFSVPADAPIDARPPIDLGTIRLLAADERPGIQGQQPKNGVKLQPGLEEKLKWGEPVKGLRAALVIRPAFDKPKAGDKPDLYLVVQNVSKAPIRFSDINVMPNVDLRVLYLKIDGKTKSALGARVPALGDFMLQPREVAYLIMLSPDSKVQDGHTMGSFIAKGALRMRIKPWSRSYRSKVHRQECGPASSSPARRAEQRRRVIHGRRTRRRRRYSKCGRKTARKNGNIPGGLVGRLRDKVKEFVRINTGDLSGDPYAKKMAPLVANSDAARDWTPAEVVPLLDAIAAITTIPLETTMEEAVGRTIKTGVPLPRELASAPWGAAQPSGLRMAWLLEPCAAEYRLGTPLKSRILLHNSGKTTVVFRARTWNQSGDHKATDAQGADIKVESIEWTTLGRLATFRLEPGEFVEVSAAGIGVGAVKNDKDWQNTRVGSWIDAKAGDDVTFMPAVVPLSDWKEPPPRDGQPGWWLDFITARLQCAAPLPADKTERERLLYRVAMDLFGTPVSAEIIATFVADRQPNALDSLAKRLAQRAELTAFSGPLTSGATKFRVLPADPDAAKKKSQI